jgi:CBS-domain-containing membrane protein
MSEPATISVQDIAAGNVGFILAQAILEALIKRKVLAPEDVAPMLQEVVDLYRQPSSDGRQELNAMMANVLAAIIGRHMPPAR